MNLGLILAGLDQGDSAAQLLEEASDIWRELAKNGSVDSKSSLALSLVNLGAFKTRTHPEEAISLLRQAAKIYELIALTHTDYLVSLAGCLLNLAGALSAAKQYRASLPISERSNEIWRKLREKRPDAYSSDLASSLLNHGAILSMLGEHKESLHFTEEGVAILRNLETRRTGKFAVYIAQGLSNLGATFLDLGNHQSAAQALKESLCIKDSLRPAPADLAFTTTADLHRLAQALIALEQPLEALSPAAEAIRLFTPYFLQLPRQLGEVMVPMVTTYVTVAQSAGQQLDPDIMHPIENDLANLGYEFNDRPPTAHKPHPPPH